MRTCRWHCSRITGKHGVIFGRARDAFTDKADSLLSQVGIASQAERACGVLAYGDLKRVELAVALANAPKLLLMDEPTAGMSPRERIALMELTACIAREQSIAVLFTEHDMDVVFAPRRPHHRARSRPIDCRRQGRRRAREPGRASRLSRRRLDLRGTLMLKVEDLHTYYGRAHILAGVAFEATHGEVVVLLGRNGAGKSTTMKAIMGLVPPARGRIRFQGTDITRKQPFEIARLGLGYVPEDRRIFAELTVQENLEVGRRPPNANAPRGRSKSCSPCFRTWRACATGRAARCRAASSRC